MTSGAVALFLLAMSAAASASAQDPRLAGRLDSATGAALASVMESARAKHLPTEPLVDRALEGLEKGAPSRRIVEAVHAFANELETARNTLGLHASTSELEAGASALSAGVPAGDLSRLRLAAPSRSLTTALTVVSDLVARSVPVADAVNAMVALTGAGVEDQDLTVFQRNVRTDIARGADPGTATSTRAHAMRLHARRGDRKLY